MLMTVLFILVSTMELVTIVSGLTIVNVLMERQVCDVILVTHVPVIHATQRPFVTLLQLTEVTDVNVQLDGQEKTVKMTSTNATSASCHHVNMMEPV